MLLKSSEPTGIDGYYYSLQAKSLIERGSLENPDYKLGYYLCALCSYISNDAITGVKIWASLAAAILCLSVFFLLKTLTSNNAISFVSSMICASSFSLTQFSVNFINNLTGLFFFVFYCVVLFAIYKPKNSKSKKIILLTFAVLLFTACVFSHLVSAAFALIFTTFFLLNKLSLKNKIILICAAIFFACVFFIGQLPRFKNVFSIGPFLPVFSGFMKKAAGTQSCIELSLTAILCWIIFTVELILSIKNKTLNLLIFLIPVFFFPFWKLDSLDMGYRMFLNGFIPGVIFITERFYLYSEKSWEKYKDKNFYCVKNILYYVIALCFIQLAIKSPDAYDPQLDPPYSYYSSVVKKIDLPDDSLLIAHLGLNHTYTYYQNLRDALNYIPDFFVEKEKLWRLSYGINFKSYKRVLHDIPEEEFKSNVKIIDSNYILIREDLFQHFLQNEEPEIAETYRNFFNPYTTRPQFIRKSKKIKRSRPEK